MVRTLWCLFLGWLMRITFGFTPASVLQTQRDLVAARVHVDALKVARSIARAEATEASKRAISLQRAYEAAVDVAFEKNEEATALREELAKKARLS